MPNEEGKVVALKLSDNNVIDKLVVQLVEAVQGCKTTELVVKLMEAAMNDGIPLPDPDQVTNSIERCIQNGRVLSIKYVLPNMNYREKQFLLPAGSSITV